MDGRAALAKTDELLRHHQIRCGVGDTGQKPAFRFFFGAQARPLHAVSHAAAVQTADAGAANTIAARTQQFVSSGQSGQQHGLIRAGSEGSALRIQLGLKMG